MGGYIGNSHASEASYNAVDRLMPFPCALLCFDTVADVTKTQCTHVLLLSDAMPPHLVPSRIGPYGTPIVEVPICRYGWV